MEFSLNLPLPLNRVPERTFPISGVYRDLDEYLAWIIHDFAGEKRKGALKD
jgi:hypothetical protein